MRKGGFMESDKSFEDKKIIFSRRNEFDRVRCYLNRKNFNYRWIL